MRRKIKYSVIQEVAIKLKQQIEELKTNKDTLLADINRINDGYKGVDATTLVNKYKEKLQIIDAYINILEKYQICFEWLSGCYRDSHNKANNSITELNGKIDLTGEGIMAKSTIIPGISSFQTVESNPSDPR